MGLTGQKKREAVKAKQNSEFLLILEAEGFIYNSNLRSFGMQKKILVHGLESNLNLIREGNRLLFEIEGYDVSRRSGKRIGFHLIKFNEDLKSIVKFLGSIIDMLIKHYIGFLNRRVDLEEETIFLSEYTCFSTKNGFIDSHYNEQIVKPLQ